MSDIYTHTGDGGTTSLADGTRVAKCSPRVDAYGTIDEANSCVGLARAAVTDPWLDGVLAFLQQRLLNCSARLATPPAAVRQDTPAIAPGDVEALEAAVDSMTETTGDVGRFVLPAGCESAARLHVARAVVRRAERAVLDLAEFEVVDIDLRAFVNRASDLLFAAARYAAHIEGVADEFWDPDAPAPR